MITQLIKEIDDWIWEGIEQGRAYHIELEKEGGKLNLTLEGFFYDIVLPIIKWTMIKIKPG